MMQSWRNLHRAQRAPFEVPSLLVSFLCVRTCVVSDDCVIGKYSSIGVALQVARLRLQEGTVVSRCVIGKNCKIGANVKLTNCYLWDNVVVGDGASAEFSVLADGAVLKERVAMAKNCVVSFGVTVGPGSDVPAATRLTKFVPHDDFGDEVLRHDG